MNSADSIKFSEYAAENSCFSMLFRFSILCSFAKTCYSQKYIRLKMFRTSGIINKNDDRIHFGYTASFTATEIYIYISIKTKNFIIIQIYTLE